MTVYFNDILPGIGTGRTHYNSEDFIDANFVSIEELAIV
jgi:hypothetical protein